MKKQKLNKETNQVPYKLKSTQQWFASVITNRLGENGAIQTYSPNGMLMSEDASRYITASSNLRPHQRMQIYNQQYWWRLLTTLHSNFPLVTRLFGYQAFNERIGISYLLKYPPDEWSLTLLGRHLPQWVEECYKEPDRSLIYNATSLDWAFAASFTAAQCVPLDLHQLETEKLETFITSSTLYLQPSIYLFSWEYDLFVFREEFLKQSVDYWTENRFPELPKERPYYFILYRTVKNTLAWREICQGEFLLLKQFKEGATVEAACHAIINAEDTSIYEEVVTQLQQWLQQWTQMGWLTLTPHVESSKSSEGEARDG